MVICANKCENQDILRKKTKVKSVNLLNIILMLLCTKSHKSGCEIKACFKRNSNEMSQISRNGGS